MMDIYLLTLAILYVCRNGDGSRQPSVKELEIARQQGEDFGRIVDTYVRGKNSGKNKL